MKKSSSSSSSSAETAATIQKLLKKPCNDNDVRADAARFDELRRIFANLKDEIIETTATTTTTMTTDEETNTTTSMKKWRTFLQTKLHEFIQQLYDRITNQQQQQQNFNPYVFCRTLWGVIATQPTRSKTNNDYEIIHLPYLEQFIYTLVTCTSNIDLHDQQLYHMIQVEFLGIYRDVQYYSMIAIINIANRLYDEKHNEQPDRSKKAEVYSERLLQLILLISLPNNQKELEDPYVENITGKYLFPPPPKSIATNKLNYAKDEDNDSSEDDDDDESSLEDDIDIDELDEIDGDDSLSENDDDDDDDDERPLKRAKIDNKGSSSSSNKKYYLLPYQKLNNHKRLWCKVWFTILRLPLSDITMKQVLRIIPEQVLPIAGNPLKFADFYMNAFNSNNNNNNVSIPILALDGLFILMTQHGLEYNDFYKQLYKLIKNPNIMHMKQRNRFAILLDKCLCRNEMLPAHIVAAFVKRLLRNCLSSSPSTCMFILALCSNLLRKHPEIHCLIQRNNTKTNNNDKDNYNDNNSFNDGFDSNTDDPEQTNALQSTSLWELNALEKHYYPAVVTMAKSIGREDELNTPLHNINDFLITYSTLFEQERNKRRQQKRNNNNNNKKNDNNNKEEEKKSNMQNYNTPLTFHKPKTLFTDTDVFAGILSIPK